MKQKPVRISFWGVRGSIPSFFRNSNIGGHTSCVSIAYESQQIVCDAGTGLYPLGKSLSNKKIPLAIFLSHYHWDHIFGLPFFVPFYEKNRKIKIFGPALKQGVQQNIAQIMRPPFFPITTKEWKSNPQWCSIKESNFTLGKCKVESRWIKHVGDTLGYQFKFPGDRRIAYITDHYWKKEDQQFSKWISGADILIHDTHFDRKELSQKKNWGHSAFEDVFELASKAKVKKLVLFHHDPKIEDKKLEGRLKWCRQRSTRNSTQCIIAKEGLILDI